MTDRQSTKHQPSILGEIETWMDQRNADIRRFSHDAERVGRNVWDLATRTGENLRAEQSADLRALGEKVLRQNTQSTRVVASPRPRPTNPGPKNPSLIDRGGRAAALAAIPAGQVVGAFKGFGNAARDIRDTAEFGARLLNPLDSFTSPDGEAAWNDVLNGAQLGIDRAKVAFSNPRQALAGIGQAYERAKLKYDPSATPQADTIGGEWERNYEIGKNQGELGFGVGSTLYGGAVLKELAGVRALSKEAQVAKYLKQGFNPEQAAYLAEPYSGMGHHNVARSFTFPKKVGPLPLPKALVGKAPPNWFIESPFNVLEPRNISRGDFYELHYKVDPQFHYANLPGFRRTGGWHGEKLGLEKYEGLERAWHASPAPLKAAAGGVPMGTGALVYDVFEGEDPQ